MKEQDTGGSESSFSSASEYLQLDTAEARMADVLTSVQDGRLLVNPEHFGTADMQVARQELEQLPFVSDTELRYSQVPLKDRPPETEQRGVEFPVDRIVGANTFESWAGRREGHGKTSHEGKTKSSLGVIVEDYAPWMRQASDEDLYGKVHPRIQVFADSEGKLWGFAEDGTHRVAAAKLNGRATIPVDLYMAQSEYLPRLDRPVLEG